MKIEEAVELARHFQGTKNSDWTPFIAPLGDIVPNTPIPDIDMCLVPVGEFNNVVITSPYWIARYPVTNAQWRIAVALNPEWFSFSVKHIGDYYHDDSKGDYPVLDVDSFMLGLFARWVAGQDLISERQWEYAVSGVENWDYPWGNELIPERCVYAKNYVVEGLQPVSAKPRGVSWVGAVQLAGNVNEIVKTHLPFPNGLTSKGGSYRNGEQYLKASSRFPYPCRFCEILFPTSTRLKVQLD